MRAALLSSTALLLVAGAAPGLAQAPTALPTGGQVTAGQAAISRSGTQTQINQSTPRAVIDWQRFDVGRDASVRFNQPGAGSWTLNRVATPDPSMIAGRITANGGIAIVNPSGVIFAQGAQVTAGALVATTSNISNRNFMAGRMEFEGAARPGARIENHGRITVAERGLAALVGPSVANSGTISARLGTAVLAGGAESFRLDLAGDGMLSLEVTQAARRTANGGTALVTNSGIVEANGGRVVLSADAASGLVEDLVRNTGQLRANAADGRAGRVTVAARGGNAEIASGTLAARGGTVEVTASGGQVRVGEAARVSASSAGGGGHVQLGGAGTASVRVEGRVSARGTGAGSQGGRIAVQAEQRVTVASTARLDTSGQAGGGTVLLGTTGVGRAQAMASETRVETGAVVRADALGTGAGGVIVVNSRDATLMLGDLSVRGGPAGGDGGFVEVSGQRALTLDFGRIDVRAPRGRPGQLLLDPDSIDIITGSPSDPPIASNVAAGDPPSALVVSGHSIRQFPGTLTLEASNSVTVNGEVDATLAGSFLTGLILRTINPGSTVQVNAPITLSTGPVNLESAGAVGVSASGPITATGGFFRAGTTITLDGAVNLGAGTLGLDADGTISGGAAITAGLLSVRGTAGGSTGAGSLSLSNGNVASLDALTTGGLTFANNLGLSVAQAISSGSNVEVSAFGGGTLTVAGIASAAAGGRVTLRADAMELSGPVVVSGGEINIRVATAGVGINLGAEVGGVSLTNPELAQLSTSGGRLRLSSANGVTLANAIGLRSQVGTLEIEGLGGGVSQGSGSLDVGRVVVRLPGNTSLNQTGNQIDEVAFLVSGTPSFTLTTARPLTVVNDVASGTNGITGGAIALTSTGAITLAAPITGGAVNLSAGGAISGTGLVTATSLTIPSAASVTLTGANLVGTLDAQATGDLAFDNAQALTVTRAQSATGNVQLGGSGEMILAGPVSAAAAGAVVLRARDANAGLTIASDAATPVAGELTLRASQLAAFVSGETLALRANGTGQLRAATNFTSPTVQLELTGGSVRLDTAVTGPAGGRVRLVADSGLDGPGSVIVPDGALPGFVEILRRGGGAILVDATPLAGTLTVAPELFARLDAAQVMVGGIGTTLAASSSAFATSAVTLSGDINRTGRALGLRASGDVLQQSGTVTASAVFGSAGGTFRLGASDPTARTANAIGQIGVATTQAAVTGLTAGGDLRIDTSSGLLTVARPVAAGTGAALRLVADDLDVQALLSAPGGRIAVRPFTDGTTLRLGGTGPGFSLTTAEIALLGDAGAPTGQLRFGQDATGNFGDIIIAGSTALRGGATTRVGQLELFAGGAAGTASLTGSGVIDVASLTARATGSLFLTGAHNVDSLVTTTGLPGAGFGQLTLQSGAGVATPGGAGGGNFRFTTSGAVSVQGSVLASGIGDMLLNTVSGGITIAPGAWVATENGAMQVIAAGEALNNAGNIVAGGILANAGPGSLVSGVGGTNSGLIALGLNATPSSISGLATNASGGVMLANTISAIAGPGLRVSDAGVVGELAGGATVIGGTTFGDQVLGGGVTIRGRFFGSLTATSINNEGAIYGPLVEATSGSIISSGVLLGSQVKGAAGISITTGRVEAGTGTATPSLSIDAAQIRAGATNLTAPPVASVPATTETPGGALSIDAVTGNIALSGGNLGAAVGQSVNLTARTGAIVQTGGAILAPDIAASAAGAVSLNEAANSFSRVIAWSAPAGATALPGLAGYGAGSGTGAVQLTTTAPALTLEGGLLTGTGALVDVQAASGALVLNAPSRFGTAAPGVVTLRADAMTFSAGLAAPASTFLLRSFTPGLAITLGDTLAGTFSLSAASLTQIGAGGAAAARLRIGREDAGAITIAGPVDLRPFTAPVGPGSVSDPIAGARVEALELVSSAGVTQTPSGRLNVADLSVLAGGAVLLHGDPPQGQAALNALDRVVPGTLDGTLTTLGGARGGIAATGDVALTSWRSLSVVAGAPITAATGNITLRVAPGALPGPIGSLSVAAPLTATAATPSVLLVADDMALSAAVSATGGAIRVMPFSPGRGVTLGSAGAGTLALDPGELGQLDAGAGTLRIGRASPGADAGNGTTALNGNTVGTINVTGPVDRTGLSDRLELFAGAAADTLAGTGVLAGSGDITGGGAITVNRFAAMATRAIALTGDNSVTTLAGITDAPNLIAAPAFANGAAGTVAGGTILGLPLSNAALWAGAGQARGGAEGGGLVFRNTAPDLSTEASVLSSGVGNASLVSTGSLSLAAGRWVAAEAGQISVTAALALTNAGSIVSGNASGGQVTSGAGGVNLGTIAPGRTVVAGDSIVSGFTTNDGVILAGRVVGTGTNAATGRISATEVANLATNLGTLRAGSISGSVLTNTGLLSGDAASFSGTITNAGTFAAATLATGRIVNTGTVFTTSLTATAAGGTALTNEASGVIRAGGGAGNDGFSTLDLRGRALAWEAPSGSVTATSVAGENVTLVVPSAGLRNAGTVTAPGALFIDAAADGDASGGTLSAGGALGLTTGGALRFTGGGATAGSTLRLTSALGSLDLATNLSAGTAMALESISGDVLHSAGSITAAGGLSLNAAGSVRQTGGSLAAASLGTLVRGASAGGDFLLDAGPVSLPVIHDVTAGGRLSIRGTGGNMTLLGQATSGTALAIEAAAGSLTASTRGIIAGTGLSLAGRDGVTLGAISVAGGGDVALASVLGAVNLTGTTGTAGARLSLAAGGGMRLQGASLFAGSDLSANAGGDTQILGGSLGSNGALGVSTGGALAVTGAALSASTSTATDPGAFRPLRLSAGGPIGMADAAVTAERAEIVSQSGAVTTGGTRFNIGTGLLLAGSGGVGVSGEPATILLPLDAGRLPLLIIDTRRGLALTRLPDALVPVTADVPGREADQQRWQVPVAGLPPGRLLFGRDDGVPAPLSNAPAGPVVLDLAAGASPAFLLLDGGTATGSIEAGRLGVFGRPGSELLPGGRSVDLTGSLGGTGTTTAARFASLAGIAAGAQPNPADAQLYRFNNCVFNSVSCDFIVIFQLPQIPLITAPNLRADLGRNDESDVLLPNVSERDY